MNYAFNGFSIKTGVAIVDPMLNRGGVLSMSELLVTFMVASVMGAVITSTGILDVLAKNVLLKFIKNRTILIIVTLIYCYIVNFLTAGGQTVSIIVTEQTFESTFEDMNINRKVLSRTLEEFRYFISTNCSMGSCYDLCYGCIRLFDGLYSLCMVYLYCSYFLYYLCHHRLWNLG